MVFEWLPFLKVQPQDFLTFHSVFIQKKIFIYVITYCLRQEIMVIDILALLKYFYEETLIGI